MSNGKQIFGAETEVALVARDVHGNPMSPREAIGHFHEIARRETPHLGDGGGGMFLRNAARLYRDSSGDVDHLEYATPETDNPWDAVRHVLAGETVLLGLAKKLCENGSPVTDAHVFKHSANYGGKSAAWAGMHESYRNRRVPGLREQILPFLVSRPILTGAGGFDPNSPGISFLLSPRVAQLKRTVSGDTTFGRGIFNTRDESLTRNDEEFARLHIICGEGNMSETSMWLKFGTTALVVAMIGGGVQVGLPVQLKNSLRAMRRFASDPDLRCRCRAAGGLVSAVDIQRHYLEEAEAHLGSDFIPEWAGEVCQMWRAVLDLEAGGAGPVADRLDWAIKHALFTRRLEARGFSWDQLVVWNRLAARVQRAVTGDGDDGYLNLRHIEDPVPAVRETVWGADLGRLREFIELRDELFELDIRMMQAGDDGLFSGLDRSGVLRHHIDGVDRIEDAVASPPEGTRAKARGEIVRTLAGTPEASQVTCGWDRVCNNEKGSYVDLGSPLETEVTWKKSPPGIGVPPWLRSPRGRPDLGTLFSRARSRALSLYDEGDLDGAYRLFSRLEADPIRETGLGDDDFYRHFSWVAARRGCGAKARELVVSLYGPPPEEGGDPPSSFQQILEWTLVLRHRGLGVTAASPELGRWISRGEEWIAERDTATLPAFRRASFLGHLAMWSAFVDSRPDEAEKIHEDARGILGGAMVHSFPKARIHLDAARLAILRGQFEAAGEFLENADEICGRNGFQGEKALILLLRAQSAYASNPACGDVALAHLREAREILEAKPNVVTSAKVAAAAARIGQSSDAEHDAFQALVGRRDSLRDCPLARRILTHWDEWADGFSCEEATGVDRDWWGL